MEQDDRVHQNEVGERTKDEERNEEEERTKDKERNDEGEWKRN